MSGFGWKSSPLLFAFEQESARTFEGAKMNRRAL